MRKPPLSPSYQQQIPHRISYLVLEGLWECQIWACGPDLRGSVGWASSSRQRSPVRFLARTHAWVADLDPSRGTIERQPIDASLSDQYFSPSLSLSLPLSLKLNKIFFKKWDHNLYWVFIKNSHKHQDKCETGNSAEETLSWR